MLDTVSHQAFLNAITSAAVVVDQCGTIISANHTWERFSAENGGDDKTYYVGSSYLDVCSKAQEAAGAAEASVVAAGLRAVLDGKDEFRCEYACHSPTELRWFEVVISPLVLGHSRLALVLHHDVTRRRRQQDEVRRAQADSNALAALVANSADAIISFDYDGIIQTWNAAATRLYGYRPDEIIGRSVEILIPADNTEFLALRDRVIAGQLSLFEVRRRTKAGELRDVAVSAAAVRDPDGAVLSILGIHRDITEEKATREHLAFVTRELSHRSKNLLAIIVAIERQTALTSRTLEDFHARFAARLRALEASLDLLVAQSWTRVSLAELARSQLSAFVSPEDERLLIEGPEVTLDSPAVEALGMSLHELATNAMKHGALGSSAGAIRLRWDIERGPSGNLLDLRWDEDSPALTSAPERTGFGHIVVTRLIERKLGAKVAMEFSPGRVFWHAVVPEKHFWNGG